MSYARKLHFPPLELKGPVSRARIWYEFHLAHIKQIWLAQQLFSQGFNPLCKVPGRADGALRVLRGDQTRASFNNTGTDIPVNGKRQSKENLIFFFYGSVPLFQAAWESFSNTCLLEREQTLQYGEFTTLHFFGVFHFGSVPCIWSWQIEAAETSVTSVYLYIGNKSLWAQFLHMPLSAIYY